MSYPTWLSCFGRTRCTAAASAMHRVRSPARTSWPTTGRYVQATMIKIPDTSHGLWPGLWFLGAGATNETGSPQGGFISCYGPTVNWCPITTGYFDNAGTNIDSINSSVGFDASAAPVTYGVEYIPGKSITEWVNGVQYWQVTQAEVPGGITKQAYNIIINLQVGLPTQPDGTRWRTGPRAAWRCPTCRRMHWAPVHRPLRRLQRRLQLRCRLQRPQRHGHPPPPPPPPRPQGLLRNVLKRCRRVRLDRSRPSILA